MDWKFLWNYGSSISKCMLLQLQACGEYYMAMLNYWEIVHMAVRWQLLERF